MSHPMQLRVRRAAVVAMAVALVAACSDATGPERDPKGAMVTLAWNARARTLASSFRETPAMASRTYAALSVAQYDAAALVDARIHRFEATRPDAHRMAIAAASREVLSALYPAVAGDIRDQFEAQQVKFGTDGTPVSVLALAEEAGVLAAREVLERLSQDGADAVWEGEIPTGEGYWIGYTPQYPHWGGVRPWLMASGDQFRAPPPPAFDSPEFKAALAEVRSISDARTKEQRIIALRWADGVATATPPGHWNQIAHEMIGLADLTETRATRILATLNMAMMDAMIACWDSKFAYWTIRPWQADTAIRTVIGHPQHPSYPSGHSCASGAAARVLGVHFLGRHGELAEMAREASLSRLYAGVHYRFDLEAGAAIGHAVGGLALERGPEGRRP